MKSSLRIHATDISDTGLDLARSWPGSWIVRKLSGNSGILRLSGNCSEIPGAGWLGPVSTAWALYIQPGPCMYSLGIFLIALGMLVMTPKDPRGAYRLRAEGGCEKGGVWTFPGVAFMPALLV